MYLCKQYQNCFFLKNATKLLHFYSSCREPLVTNPKRIPETQLGEKKKKKKKREGDPASVPKFSTVNVLDDCLIFINI